MTETRRPSKRGLLSREPRRSLRARLRGAEAISWAEISAVEAITASRSRAAGAPRVSGPEDSTEEVLPGWRARDIGLPSAVHASCRAFAGGLLGLLAAVAVASGHSYGRSKQRRCRDLDIQVDGRRHPRHTAGAVQHRPCCADAKVDEVDQVDAAQQDGCIRPANP